MIKKFRSCYPQGSLISELLTINQGKYVVKVIVQGDGITLGTGLAAAETLEQAEDQARIRALATLDLNSLTAIPTIQPQSSVITTTSQKVNIPKSESINSKPEDNSVVVELSSDHHLSQLQAAPISKTSQPQQKTEQVSPSPESVSSESELEPPSLPWDEPVTTSEFTPEATPVAEIPESIQESQAKANLPQPTSEAIPVAEIPESIQESQAEANLPQPTPEAIPVAEIPESIQESQAEANLPDAIEFEDLIFKIDMEMKRLGWGKEQGRKHLIETYGKKSRSVLSDQELWEFFKYLESLPSPM